MKTSVEIDERKLALARKYSQTKTLKELIDQALEAYIANARRNSMADLLGTDFFAGDLQTMRQTLREKKRHGRSHR